MLRVPGLRDDGRGRAALAEAEGPSKKGMMSVVPGGLDEHAPQVRIPRFGDPAAGLCGSAGILRGHEAGKRHHAWGRGKAARVPEFDRDGEGGEIVNAAEAAEPFDAGAERLKSEQVSELGIDGVESPDGFLDGPHVRAMGVLKRRDLASAGPPARRRDASSTPSWSR